MRALEKIKLAALLAKEYTYKSPAHIAGMVIDLESYLKKDNTYTKIEDLRHRIAREIFNNPPFWIYISVIPGSIIFKSSINSDNVVIDTPKSV